MSFAAVQRILGLLLTVFSFTLMPPFLVSLFAQDGTAVAFATASWLQSPGDETGRQWLPPEDEVRTADR